MKKILNITTTTQGGAGIASLRFHNAFSRMNLDSFIVTNDNKSKKKIKNKILINKKKSFFNRLIDIIRLLKSKISLVENFIIKKNRYCFYSFVELEDINFKNLHNLPDEVDIIIIHWADNFMNLKNILYLKEYYKCKIIFFMYDMHIITGGCHYSYECKLYKSQCYPCPAVPSFLSKKVKDSFLIKKRILNKINGTLIVFSNNDYKKAKESKYKFKKIYKSFIPIFLSKQKKTHIKKNINTKYILPSSLKFDPRKGFFRLKQVIQELSKILEKNEKVIIFSKINKYVNDFTLKNIQIKNIDSFKNIEQVFYNSDLYLNLSTSDSAPQMLTEALKSGLPIISTDVGNASELITEKNNGFLFRKYDPKKIANTLYHSLFKKNFINFSKKKIILDTSKKYNFKNFQREWHKIISEV